MDEIEFIGNQLGGDGDGGGGFLCSAPRIVAEGNEAVKGTEERGYEHLFSYGEIPRYEEHDLGPFAAVGGRPDVYGTSRDLMHSAALLQ